MKRHEAGKKVSSAEGRKQFGKTSGQLKKEEANDAFDNLLYGRKRGALKESSLRGGKKKTFRSGSARPKSSRRGERRHATTTEIK